MVDQLSEGRKKVILVTDGDQMARLTMEEVAKQIGGHLISSSAGNPTRHSGREIAEDVLSAAGEPVLVMFDDNGHSALGPGERAMQRILDHRGIDVLGALAVAAQASRNEGIIVHFSIDCYARKVYDGVDKCGRRQYLPYPMVYGDTLGVLRGRRIPIVVGIGDIGKMGGYDSPVYGSRVSLRAVREVMALHGMWSGPLPWFQDSVPCASHIGVL